MFQELAAVSWFTVLERISLDFFSCSSLGGSLRHWEMFNLMTLHWGWKFAQGNLKLAAFSLRLPLRGGGFQQGLPKREDVGKFFSSKALAVGLQKVFEEFSGDKLRHLEIPLGEICSFSQV